MPGLNGHLVKVMKGDGPFQPQASLESLNLLFPENVSGLLKTECIQRILAQCTPEITSYQALLDLINDTVIS